MKKYPHRIETALLHAGYDHHTFGGSQAVPIVQTTSFRFRDSGHASALFNMKEEGNIYSRISNPTNEVLEKRVAMLEGGEAALAFSSGQAAIAASILTIAGSGDEIIAGHSLYGGTHNLFRHAFGKLGIKVHFVPINELKNHTRLFNTNTRAVYTETISNPSLEIADIPVISGLAHENGVPLIVDNTVSPYIFFPLEHGADIVLHSATKFIGGHGNSLGGIIVDSGNFDWTGGRFPYISEPDPEFHDLDFIEAFRDKGNVAYILKARAAVLRDFGASLSPFNSFLLLQGLETLPLRMREHLRNTETVAEFLRSHPAVSRVNYPGKGDSENDRRAKKYFSGRPGSIIGFEIVNGLEGGKKFIDSLRLIAHLANIGDTRTLAIHPASTTHSRLTDSEKKEAGIREDYIRLSVGIEDPEDIIADLDQALIISGKRGRV